MKKNIIIKKVETEDEYKATLLIRQKVFVEEQNVPTEIEYDGLDDICDHYIILVNSEAAACTRVRYLDNGVAKIQRVAVVKTMRGLKLGKAIMEYVIQNIIESKKANEIKLSSQIQASGFYLNLGFKEIGEEYIEAGIPHRDMSLSLYNPLPLI